MAKRAFSASRSGILLILALLTMTASPDVSLSASSGITLSKGQTVYVPAYSNVFSGPKNKPFQLAATLSIRNTDLSSSFRVSSIDYYDTTGKLLRHYLQNPLILKPMQSTYVHIEERDIAGGFGANFIVRWNADKIINAPIIECVMIGATSGQGISFVSPGQEIRE